MKQGDLVRISPTRFAKVIRIMFYQFEVIEHIYGKQYKQFEIERDKVSIILSNTCEVCNKTFDEDDLTEFHGPQKTQIVCFDCLNDVQFDAEHESNDCPICGGSGGGPEHWRCTSCGGKGVIERDRNADNYDEDYGGYDDPAMDYVNP